MTSDLKQETYWEDEHGHRTYDHPVVEFFARQRIDFIRTCLDLCEVRNALDVGCGDGFSTYYMHEHVADIWAVDHSRRMLSRHPLKKNGRVSRANALRLPFADNTFDLVYSWEMLHHISDPLLAVAEMARVSRRYILVAEPNRSHPAQLAFALVDREHRWVLRFARKYMRDLFEESGLTVSYVGCGGWLFPNITPEWLLPMIKSLPYRFPLGISNWVLGHRN